MSEDSFTEVSHTSWGGRIKTSFKGILFGLVLFLGAFPLLFWNEGRAVKRYQTLKEGEGAVVSVAPDRVDPANQGRLVHLSGTADTRETLTDSTFAVSQTALRLKRTVEMYQWKETKSTRTEKKAGGGEKKVTTYSYSRVWSSSLIRSSGFKRRSGHENPGSMPFPSQTRNATNVTVGAFKLSPALIQEIDNWKPVSMDASSPVPAALGSRGMIHGDGYYRGDDPGNPAIGDVRITFKAVYPGPVSLIAAQQGSSFAPYAAKTGGTISLLQTGTHSAVDMFKTAHFHNRLLTWGLRAGGMLMLFIGLTLLLKPLSVFADVIPFVGNIVAAGTGLIAFVLALFFGLMVMGVAWIFYRPVLGFSLMGAGTALVVWVIWRRKKASKPAKAPLTPPVQPAARSASTPSQAQGPAPGPPPPPGPPPVPPAMPAAVPSDPAPPTAEDWIKNGKQAYVAGRFDKAAEAFEKAIQLDPQNGSALYNLGVVRNKSGDTAGAIEVFKQAARLGHERAIKLLSSQAIDW
ncbi:TMEM43 family protein [uncultured Desulfosarcina sp.]|uniref:TMEM43 family protein n=1 Tax=uncultured Desulfosarcina sp. TaxID=218289 RepID=UPI0029C9ACC1|nr:TMEM43 family protein [uncultured Desulfosarcina sp.]